MTMFKLASAAALASLALSAPATAQVRQFTDAVTESDYVHAFDLLDTDHNTRVVIDRGHQTIYAAEEGATGAEVMLDIMARDGFAISFTEAPLDQSLAEADILIVHGLPNDEIALPNDAISWRSPLTGDEVEALVRWIDGGGSLFLTLSHFPGGSGARPLLDALSVQFADGYIWHESALSYTDPVNGRCSHFFGMSPEQGLVNSDHPALAGGLSVERVDYLCGAAIARAPDNAILRLPPGTQNHPDGELGPEGPGFFESSDSYAGIIGFAYGQGRVVVSADQGMFRNFIFTFDETEQVYVTVTSPENDNANLFINLMRWLGRQEQPTGME